MAPNSLSPASMVIDYHSAYGAHKMTIPTLAWFPTSITGNLGSYQAWDLSTIDAEVMMSALITRLEKFMTPLSAFDQATVYTQASPTSPNIPRASVGIGTAGISSNTNNQQAVSQTWNFKTAGNGNMKIILLDSPLIAWLAKVPPTGMTSDQLLVGDEIMSSANAWSGRDDTQPNVLRNITWDVNDKLQKQYFG